jgi:hypothetical protein
MKVSSVFTLLLGSSLLLSASAFAGATNKKSLHFDQNVTVQGKLLAPGDYKIERSGSGPDVKVNILKGKEIVASVSARIVSEKAPNRQDGYSATAERDGSHSVTQIFFSGDKFDLQFGQASSANAAPAATTSGTN